MELLVGKEIASKIKENVKNEISLLSKKPKYVVLVNKDDSSSLGYVRAQEKNANSVGIEFESIMMEGSEEAYLNKINELNNDSSVNAIMVTRPLFKGADENKIVSKISYLKDVDSVNAFSMGELLLGENNLVAPATATSIIRLLEGYNIPLSGKKALVIGRSLSVGKPVAMLLLNKNATVTIAHSKTTNLNELIKDADIIIAAIGKAEFIDSSLAKKDAVIIDAGIHYLDDGRIVGDVKVSDAPAFISKVPGGVGVITSAVLMENILSLSKKHGTK